MSNRILIRMGDGERISMTPDQVKEDLLMGTQDAADRGNIPALTSDELEHLYEIFADPNRIVAVSPGEEVITTDDGASGIMVVDQPDGGTALPMGYFNAVLAVCMHPH